MVDASLHGYEVAAAIRRYITILLSQYPFVSTAQVRRDTIAAAATSWQRLTQLFAASQALPHLKENFPKMYVAPNATR